MAAADVLARAHPDRLRVRWIESDFADGVGRLIFEDRSPGSSRVYRLPEASASRGDVPGAPAPRIDGDVSDAAPHHRGPDGPGLERLDDGVDRVCFVIIGAGESNG